MEIVNTTPEVNLVEIRLINVGDCFSLNNEIYFVPQASSKFIKNVDYNKFVFVINLDTGEEYKFKNDLIVKKVKAQVHVVE